jgi:purine-binding chemotaxis protein CheW
LSAEAPLDAEAAVTEQAPAPSPSRRACVVMLGGRPFAVDIMEAREVVVLDATTPVPGAPAALVGVMNLRGSVLPVVEARPLLGLPVRPAIGRPRALVLADADRRAAILIERVVGLSVFEQVQPLAEAEAGALAIGELVDEAGERAIVLDARAVLSAVRRAWEPVAEPSRTVRDHTPGA